MLGLVVMVEEFMSSKRWFSPWKDSLEKPAIYHCISRVVDRRFVFEDENFSGCRVLSYCVMSNHFHILLEVPPMPEAGISDEVLLKRLSATNSEAAYIDLNPVRAGMDSDPATYRWSSYGEAVGGGPKGNGKKAREGLVRACMSDCGVGFEAERWREVSRIYRRTMGLALGRKSGKAVVEKGVARPQMNTADERECKGGCRGVMERSRFKGPRCKCTGHFLPRLGVIPSFRHFCLTASLETPISDVIA